MFKEKLCSVSSSLDNSNTKGAVCSILPFSLLHICLGIIVMYSLSSPLGTLVIDIVFIFVFFSDFSSVNSGF